MKKLRTREENKKVRKQAKIQGKHGIQPCELGKK
jgi:hypothetical protein